MYHPWCISPFQGKQRSFDKTIGHVKSNWTVGGLCGCGLVDTSMAVGLKHDGADHMIVWIHKCWRLLLNQECWRVLWFNCWGFWIILLNSICVKMDQVDSKCAYVCNHKMHLGNHKILNILCSVCSIYFMLLIKCYILNCTLMVKILF